MEQGKGALNKPVRLYAQLAIDSARSIDSLFNDSLMTLAKDLSPAERNNLVGARDAALRSIHEFADWLEKRLPGMVPFKPMGEDNYNYCENFITCRSMPSRLHAAGVAVAIPRARIVVAIRRGDPTRRVAKTFLPTSRLSSRLTNAAEEGLFSEGKNLSHTRLHWPLHHSPAS